jgi:CRISPR/Cas system CSM-associated protein Csm2 small subunit
MISTERKKGESIKAIRKREKEEQEKKLRDLCAAKVNEQFGEEQLKKWSSEHKGLWFLPVMDETGEIIEALGILKPITRSVLSYASTKIQDEGLYEFLEAAMRECWIAGDTVILDEDDYFIPAAQQFNKILEGKKASLVKR